MPENFKHKNCGGSIHSTAKIDPDSEIWMGDTVFKCDKCKATVEEEDIYEAETKHSLYYPKN